MTVEDGRGVVGAHGRHVYDEELNRRRCTANSKQAGRRCKRRPSPGATTCSIHGSRAPQTERARRIRLQELADPAMAQLARLLVNAESESVRLRAVDSILDRTGYVRRTEIDVGEAKERLLERLLDRREQPDDDGGDDGG